MSVLALLLDNKKCVKFTQSGIKIFKSDLKTEIIFSFLFYTRNGFYGFICSCGEFKLGLFSFSRKLIHRREGLTKGILTVRPLVGKIYSDM